MRAVAQIEFSQYDGHAAEGVGLDDVRTGFEVSPVDAADEIGPGDIEHFRAVFTAQKVRLNRQRLLMDHRPHGSVEHKDTGGKGV